MRPERPDIGQTERSPISWLSSAASRANVDAPPRLMPALAPGSISRRGMRCHTRYHVMHVGPRDTHAIAGLQQWFDSRSAIGGSGRKADDGLATRGTRRTADETSLGGHSAVELAFELVDADLACQIDRKGLG